LIELNYRGITVLPVISKIVETIIKERIQKQVIETQNRKQRGFTYGSSLIVITRSRFSIYFPALAICSIVRSW
jgi:heme exporter protein D